MLASPNMCHKLRPSSLGLFLTIVHSLRQRILLPVGEILTHMTVKVDQSSAAGRPGIVKSLEQLHWAELSVRNASDALTVKTGEEGTALRSDKDHVSDLNVILVRSRPLVSYWG